MNSAVHVHARAGLRVDLAARSGRREPSSPTKFGIGLILVGAGFAVLVVAATALGQTARRSARCG